MHAYHTLFDWISLDWTSDVVCIVIGGIVLSSVVLYSLIVGLLGCVWDGRGDDALFPRPADGQAKSRRYLLAIAHPDDECMFFGPTLARLACQSSVNGRRPSSVVLFVLCLSSGDQDGQGWCRRRELYASCACLGVSAERVILVEHSRLQDGASNRWSRSLLSRLLRHHIVTLDIDTLITFDRRGVSGHANHAALYAAVRRLSRRGPARLPSNCRAFTLKSVGLARKYCGICDLFPSLMAAMFCRLMWWRRAGRSVVVVAPPSHWSRVQRAMRQHASQLVWFRRLYMVFSRYTFINSLVRVDHVKHISKCGNDDDACSSASSSEQDSSSSSHSDDWSVERPSTSRRRVAYSRRRLDREVAATHNHSGEGRDIESKDSMANISKHHKLHSS